MCISVCLYIILKYIKRNSKVDSDNSKVLVDGPSLLIPFY